MAESVSTPTKIFKITYINQSIKMTIWPADARSFTRPTSKAKAMPLRDEVASRRLRFEDARRIMSTEMRLKSFGPFEKWASDGSVADLGK